MPGDYLQTVTLKSFRIGLSAHILIIQPIELLEIPLYKSGVVSRGTETSGILFPPETDLVAKPTEKSGFGVGIRLVRITVGIARGVFFLNPF